MEMALLLALSHCFMTLANTTIYQKFDFSAIVNNWSLDRGQFCELSLINTCQCFFAIKNQHHIMHCTNKNKPTDNATYEWIFYI